MNAIMLFMVGFLAGVAFSSLHFSSPVDYADAVKIAYIQGQHDVVLASLEN